MAGRACRSSAPRRPGLQLQAPPGTAAAAPTSHAPLPLPARPATAAGPPQQPARQLQPGGGKAAALAAFQRLVDNASGRARFTPLPPAPAPDEPRVAAAADGGEAPALAPPAPAPQPQPRAAAAAAAPPSDPTLLVPAADRALAALREQVEGRRLTYLYQLDGALTGARAALEHLAGHVAAAAPAARLAPLFPAGTEARAAYEQLLGVCTQAWVRARGAAC